jgi:hypothetical protein
MSEHQRETPFGGQVILYDDSDEHRKLEKSIAQVQHDECCVQRVAWLMAMFLILALAGVAYGAILQQYSLYNGSALVFMVLCEVILVSLICLMAFAGLLTVYRRKLKRLREAQQLGTRRQESHLDKPDITTPPGSYRGSDDRECVQGAAEGSGYHGRLDSPSWLSNRLCG